MTSSKPSVDPRAIAIVIDDDDITVTLADGRRVSAPLAWFPRLLHADRARRENWRLIGAGTGVHWPELDEDLSVEGLLRGTETRGAAKRAI